MSRAIWWTFGWILLLWGVGGAAQATPIELRHDLCVLSAPASPDTAASYDKTVFCDGRFRESLDGWTWLGLASAKPLRTLPSDWQLLVDQTRFTRIAVEILLADGSHRSQILVAGHIGDHWAPGGLLRFTIAPAGKDIRGLRIGFQNLDALKLMRKVTAASPKDAQVRRDRWFVLAGVFCGALASAFAYNLVIYTGQRYLFQRWYLVWAGTALLYGLFWTNMIAIIVPGWAGPIAVRADLVLIGLLIAVGNMFFLSVLEPGMLPRWLVQLVRLLAVTVAAAGPVAALDGLFSPDASDALLNDIMAAGTLIVITAAGIAIRRGSRVIWFYLGGWTPVLCVFCLRLLRNFGLLPQDDLVDMATFATLAIESTMMSLAIADRFRLLRQERDIAEHAHVVSAAEATGYRRAALTDFLTGLGNRAAFHGGLQDQIAAGDPRGFALFLIDVDHLKDVNDRLGHDGGDTLLRFVATALGDVVIPGTTLHRTGGDEFALIIPGTDDRDVDRLAARLAELQGREWHHLGHSGKISLSLGSAHYPTDATDAATLGHNADLALYQAKQQGRRRHCRYEARLRQVIEDKAALVREARRSLAQDRFMLYFQPIVDIVRSDLIGYEALIRWDHPDHGLITPEFFADILVEEEIGPQIQDYVLAEVLDALRLSAGLDHFICVNFTSDQLQGPRFARQLVQRLRDANIPPERLCVEVTEGIVLQHRDGAVAIALHVLQDAGVRIALDDFGTGYASLLHLQQIPANALKIDRSFVADLGQDDGDAEEIVRAIIGLGVGLRKTVVAEGIETIEQRDALVRLGCRYGQGYLFGRPSPDFAHLSPIQAAAHAA